MAAVDFSRASWPRVEVRLEKGLPSPEDNPPLDGAGFQEAGVFGVARARFEQWVLAGLVACALASTACRTTTRDIERWAVTNQGPYKLFQVLTHDKYPLELRTSAAMALIKMSSRSGRHVGLLGDDQQPGVVAGLASLPRPTRGEIVARMLPELEAGMRLAPEARGHGNGAVDRSLPFKDAAFALLTHQGGTLARDAAAEQRLRRALSAWASASFSQRFEDPRQAFGMQQVLAVLGDEGVRQLPGVITAELPQLAQIASLLATYGDSRTRFAGSRRLVDVARSIDSQRWLREQRAVIERANAVSGEKADAERLRAQLLSYQDEELVRVLVAMKRLGGEPAADYLLNLAARPDVRTKRRVAALGALEGNLGARPADHARELLALAANADTPAEVVALALRRAAELPRQLVAPALYEMLAGASARLRLQAAESLLGSGDASHLEEFMKKIGWVRGVAMAEVLRYGSLIAGLKGPEPPSKLASKYAEKGFGTPARLSALAYYYESGTEADLKMLSAYGSDETDIPECENGPDDCAWACSADGLPPGASRDRMMHTIGTVGEFVEHCVVPAIRLRAGGGQTAGSSARGGGTHAP